MPSKPNAGTKDRARQSCGPPIQEWEVPYLEWLGTSLRALRARCDLSQEMLARRAGLSRVMICHIERGTRRTRRSTLEILMQAMGMHAEEAEDLCELTGLALAAEYDGPS